MDRFGNMDQITSMGDGEKMDLARGMDMAISDLRWDIITLIANLGTFLNYCYHLAIQ